MPYKHQLQESLRIILIKTNARYKIFTQYIQDNPFDEAAGTLLSLTLFKSGPAPSNVKEPLQKLLREDEVVIKDSEISGYAQYIVDFYSKFDIPTLYEDAL